jgi:hypothetical protein
MMPMTRIGTSGLARPWLEKPLQPRKMSSPGKRVNPGPQFADIAYNPCLPERFQLEEHG